MPATLALSLNDGRALRLAGLLESDAAATELVLRGERREWAAFASAAAPGTMLLHVAPTPNRSHPLARVAELGLVHTLAWQRPLPRGELERYAAVAAAIGRGEPGVAGALGGAGGSVLIQSLDDGSCLLSAGPAGAEGAAGGPPRFGACDAAEAVWAVGPGAGEGAASLRVTAGTSAGACLSRRLGLGRVHPLGLGRCAGRGARRWSVLPTGHLASARVLGPGHPLRALDRLAPQPDHFCVRTVRLADEEAARAWASCDSRPACRAEGLEGTCCPTDGGAYLSCCNASAPPPAAALETAPCDEGGARLVRAVPAPGLAPRAALAGAMPAPPPRAALAEPQLLLLRDALDPVARRQLTAAADESGGKGPLAALLASVGATGAAEPPAAPWAVFVEGVVASQREALAAAAAAEAAVAAAAAAASHNASARAADLAERLSRAEERSEAEETGRRLAEEQLAEVTRNLAATSARLAESAAREEELRAAAAHAKAHASEMLERAATAERLNLAAAGEAGQLRARVDGAEGACNETRARLSAIEAQLAAAKVAARRAEEAATVARSEAEGASKHEDTARKNVREALARAAMCEARVADEWQTQAECEAAAVARDAAIARLEQLNATLGRETGRLRQCLVTEGALRGAADEAATCAAAQRKMSLEAGAMQNSLTERERTLEAALAAEASAAAKQSVAEEKLHIVTKQMMACRASRVEGEQKIAELQLNVAELDASNERCATSLEASLLSANAATGGLGPLLRAGLRDLILADAAALLQCASLLGTVLGAAWAARVPASWMAFGAQARARYAAALAAVEAAAPSSSRTTWLIPLRPIVYATAILLTALALLAWHWARVREELRRERAELALQTQRVQVVRAQRKERLEILKRAAAGQQQLEQYMLQAEDDAEARPDVVAAERG